MKPFLIIFAVIGIAAVLLVAGCVGLVGYGVYTSMAKVPDGLDKPAVEREYKPILEKIRTCLESGDFEPLKSASEVIAIFTDVEGQFEDKVVYSRDPETKKSGYTIFNGAGVIDIVNGKKRSCVAYKMEVKKVDYIIALEDTAGLLEPKGPEK